MVDYAKWRFFLFLLPVEYGKASCWDNSSAYSYVPWPSSVKYWLKITPSKYQRVSGSVVGVVVSISFSQDEDVGSIPARRSCLIHLFFSGQSLGTYILLAVTYLSLCCCQKHNQHPASAARMPRLQSLWTVFKRRGIRYFFLAVVDVEANYLFHRAFHYTTLTSVQVSF